MVHTSIFSVSFYTHSQKRVVLFPLITPVGWFTYLFSQTRFSTIIWSIEQVALPDYLVIQYDQVSVPSKHALSSSSMQTNMTSRVTTTKKNNFRFFRIDVGKLQTKSIWKEISSLQSSRTVGRDADLMDGWYWQSTGENRKEIERKCWTTLG